MTSRGSLEAPKKIALSKGGRCLSKEYINNFHKLEFICGSGHKFFKSYAKLRTQWCPVCAKKRKKTIEEIRQFAKSAGLRLLSKSYTNNRTKMLWKCKDGHEWVSTYSDIKNGRICPTCSYGKSERICKSYFERIFSEKFPKVKPVWLLNTKGNRMELDGYCEKLKIAFEYHGQQHYKYVSLFKDMDVIKRQSDDNLKKEICENKGVRLIEVPFNISYEEMGKYIVDKCKKRGIEVKLPEDLNYKNFQIYSKRGLKRMQEIAKRNKGLCLSKEYINSATPLVFKCRNGHVWNAIPDNIIQGHWCGRCYGKKQSIQDMRGIAKNRGFECLSEVYINSQTKLKWKCSKGHEWEATPAKVKYGTGCPSCKYEKLADLRRKSGINKSKNLR